MAVDAHPVALQGICTAYGVVKLQMNTEIAEAKATRFMTGLVGVALGTTLGVSLGLDASVVNGVISSPEYNTMFGGIAYGSESALITLRYGFFLVAILEGLDSISNPALSDQLKKELTSPSNFDKLLKKHLSQGWANLGAGSLPAMYEGLGQNEIKHFAILAFQNFTDVAGIPLIIEQLNADDKEARLQSVLLVKKFNILDAASKIEEMSLHDRSPKVRKAALAVSDYISSQLNASR